MVWMLSITTSCGCTASMAARIWGSDVSGSSHSSGRTASSRSARRRTCCALSSALTYSVRWGHLARSCSKSVLLPMPGSPPSSVTDPGTSPPPNTRSSSARPVGWGCEHCASTWPMGMAGDDGPVGATTGSPSVSSTSEFQASHTPQRPPHLGVALAHSVQR